MSSNDSTPWNSVSINHISNRFIVKMLILHPSVTPSSDTRQANFTYTSSHKKKRKQNLLDIQQPNRTISPNPYFNMADSTQELAQFRVLLARLDQEDFADLTQVSQNRIHSLHHQIINLSPLALHFLTPAERTRRIAAHTHERNVLIRLGLDFTAIPLHERQYLLAWYRESNIIVNSFFGIEQTSAYMDYWLGLVIHQLDWADGELSDEEVVRSTGTTALMVGEVAYLVSRIPTAAHAEALNTILFTITLPPGASTSTMSAGYRPRAR